MAKYSTKQAVHEQDVITLSKQEYESLNEIYKQGLRERMASMSADFFKSICLKTIILTDGTYRVEFIVDKG